MLWGRSCADTANARDGRRDDDSRGTDQKKRYLDGERKYKDEQHEDADEKNAGECTAEKAIFSMCTRGDISA